MGRRRAVRVRIEDFEDGVLPMTCVGSGAPADRLYQLRANGSGPGWIWLALLAGPAGILVALLLSSAMRTSAHGWLPFNDGFHRSVMARVHRHGRYALGGLALLVAGLVVVVAAPRTFAPLGLLVLLLGLSIGIVTGYLWSNPPGYVRATVESGGRGVILTPVSDEFADAWWSQEARRQEARRREAEVRGAQGWDQPR
jgi:hypothetical protein